VSDIPSIFFISSEYRSEKTNYLVRSTIFLSAAKENSLFLSVFARNQENKRLPDKEYFENLFRKLATRYVMISIQCLVCRAVVEISIANSRMYLTTS